jgi:phytanoyl-CoA hydroxylase
MISDQDVRAYQRDGVIVVPEVLGADRLTAVRMVIADLVAASAGTTAHTDVYDLEPGHSPESPRVRRIKTPHKVNKLFDDIVRSAPVIGILTQLIGPGAAPAWLQAEYEVGAFRFAGGVAPGLGVLSAYE